MLWGLDRWEQKSYPLSNGRCFTERKAEYFGALPQNPVETLEVRPSSFTFPPYAPTPLMNLGRQYGGGTMKVDSALHLVLVDDGGWKFPWDMGRTGSGHRPKAPFSSSADREFQVQNGSEAHQDAVAEMERSVPALQWSLHTVLKILSQCLNFTTIFPVHGFAVEVPWDPLCL